MGPRGPGRPASPASPGDPDNPGLPCSPCGDTRQYNSCWNKSQLIVPAWNSTVTKSSTEPKPSLRLRTESQPRLYISQKLAYYYRTNPLWCLTCRSRVTCAQEGLGKEEEEDKKEGSRLVRKEKWEFCWRNRSNEKLSEIVGNDDISLY